MAATVFAALAAVVALPSPAAAQSGIAGVVKDTTGAVLPGVTVEATSEALIERTRAVVTDSDGQYKILDLRPGQYVVTFTLPGFSTLKHDGIDLPADFIATINGDMRIGALEETLTVSGQAPVVDVQTTSRSQVLGRELLDALPTGRSFQSISQLVVGVTLNRPDVGGTANMQQSYISAHGLTASNNTVQVDGMNMNSTRGDNQVQAYYNDMMSQEVTYSVGAGAEVSAGGVRVNMIPREGGNKFSGAFFSAWSSGSWQGNNLTQDLIARGLSRVDKIDKIYDFNVSEGGPIQHDKLWFFTSARKWAVNSPVADVFYTPVGSNYPTAYQQCKSGAISCEQAIDDQQIKSAMLRLTYQISPKNKLGAYMDRLYKTRGHDMTSGVDPRTASFTWRSPVYYTGQVKWTSTVTNKLLLEAGYSTNVNVTVQKMQEGVEQPRGTPGWYANASRFDRDLSTRWAATLNIPAFVPTRYNLMSSASYVTGSHSIKAGVQWGRGRFSSPEDANADLEQDYRSGVPDSVVVRNTPLAPTDKMNDDLGIFGQDAWTMKRLTVNAGLRYEWLNASNSEETAGAGRFVSLRHFNAVPNLPNWKDISPRLGAVYDVFGNAKTAVKASWNRYNESRTTGFAGLYNPLAATTARLTWKDLNGDDIAQGELGCVYQATGCEINFAQLPASFGVRSLRRADPDFQRPYNVESSVGIQHELLPRMSVGFSWVHNTWSNLTFTDNVLRTRADYSPLTIVSPLNGELITVYNLAPAKVTQIDQLDTNATSDRKRLYNSFEFTSSARLGRGATVFGGTAVERLLNVTCDDPDNPNSDRFCDQRENGIPWKAQFKAGGAYPLPWFGIQIGGAFQSLPGAPLSTNWSLSPTTRYAANCAGPCTPGALVIPTLSEATLVVPLTPTGAALLERLNQLDLRGSKVVMIGRVRFEAQLEVFNTLNSDAALTVASSNFGTQTYNQVASVIQGRIIRVGGQIKW
jgi:hypothetical protein